MRVRAAFLLIVIFWRLRLRLRSRRTVRVEPRPKQDSGPGDCLEPGRKSRKDAEGAGRISLDNTLLYIDYDRHSR